jgi:tRNA pseudouridine13 synthase
MSAWRNLPEKLAAEDKASAAAHAAMPPVNPDEIVQAEYNETFIETSAENEGRRTGFRSKKVIVAKTDKKVVGQG